MDMHGVSFFGWLHTLTCTGAILIGAFIFFNRKGTPLHRACGRWYVALMIVANLSSFGVYHFDIKGFRPFVSGPDIFGMFHWEALFTLLVLLLAWLAATRQRYAIWAYLHPVLMLTTYYMLMGGLVNEVIVRVTAIRQAVQASAPHALNPTLTPVASVTQGIVLFIFIVLVIKFCGDVTRYRREQTALRQRMES